MFKALNVLQWNVDSLNLGFLETPYNFNQTLFLLVLLYFFKMFCIIYLPHKTRELKA